MLKKILKKILNMMDNSDTISAIRRGLIMVIPILMIGAFARVLMTLPVNVYQEFLKNTFSGAFLSMLTFLYDATMGILSLYIAFSITIYYLRAKGLSHNYSFVGAMTAVASFLILSGVRIDDIDIEVFGVKGMFTAIFCAVVVSRLFILIIHNVKIPFRLYADGVDLEFNDAVIATIPCVAIIIIFTAFNYFICQIFDVHSFQEFYVHGISKIFEGKDSDFFSGFVFVVISGMFWFFGVYGSDVLDDVSSELFEPGLWENMSLVAEGKEPTQILNQEFFNVFVLLGGCGTSICLLMTIFIFSKRKLNRNLAKISTIPMIFNISEILTFGYPIIYNPYLLAPFIVTPAVAYCVAYFAMRWEIVPLITYEVESTVPIIISGYQATGSIKGSLLQIVIVIIGVLIYIPFVRMYDKSKSRNEAFRMNELTETLKKAEKENSDIELLRVPGVLGALAKCLAADIKSAIEHKEIELNYQLQYDNDYNCIGAETLLRYKHPVHGYLYPPLIIKLADESGILSKLERYLFIEAAKDYQKIKSETDKPKKISVNVTVATIVEPGFIVFLKNLKKEYGILDGEMCIEITEQMAIKSDEEFEKVLGEVKKLGYMIAIDDFSMGSTSIKYLQKNQFDIVKLDGSIVKEMMVNERSRDIISSIVYLAHSLNFSVLAEYVESEEQIEMLKKVGCNYYQGYHFSKAVKFENFLDELKNEKKNIS